MQEQFDKQLADKIRQEMEAYTPPFEAGNWADMQKRLGRKPKNNYRRLFVLCSILLMVGLAYLPFGDASYKLYLIESNQETYLVKDDLVSPNLTKTDLVKEDSTKGEVLVEQKKLFSESTIDNKELISDEDNSSSKQENEEKASLLAINRNNILQNIERNISNTEGKVSKKLSDASTAFDTINEEKLSIEDKRLQKEKDILAKSSTHNEEFKKKSQKDVINDFITESFPNNKIGQKSKKTTVLNKVNFSGLSIRSKPLLIDSLTSSSSELLPFEIRKNKNFNLDRVSYSILLEGFLNQNNRVNNFRDTGFGIGLLLNYRLGKKMQLSSGLVLKQMHGKAFPNQTRFEQDEASLEAFAFPSFSDNSINNFAASTQEKTELVTTTAHLTAIEVPLQLTYYIQNNRKGRFYISGTASSYFYLTEKYVFEKEEFQLPNRSNIRKLSIVNEEVNYGAFEHFDLFSTVTISAGIERPVTLHSTLGIEPFWSFPIFGLGQESIPINSVGVRLKYTFGK